jgi:hypothetical protein
VQEKYLISFTYSTMDMQFQATSSEILVQGMMNRGRQMFVDANPFVPLADEASLRAKVNAKLRASYKLPEKAMATKSETEGIVYIVVTFFLSLATHLTLYPCVTHVAEKPLLLLTNTESTDSRISGSATPSSSASQERDQHTSSTSLITRAVPEFMVQTRD